MTDLNVINKSMRSVFVGNISYEITEENLKDIFNRVGPVISLKMVYDKDTGKPKGYGFCEYKDQETALRAMRYLNGYEIGGRTIHVDNACTEKSRQEIQSLMMRMPTSESHHGDAVRAEKAPEIISNVVASLPPEQLYVLMKQMKEYIQSNPIEARNMLLQNPQLGYALLQAQVLMKIVDPELAETMLIPSAAHGPPSPHVPTVTYSSRTNQPMSQISNYNIQWSAPIPPIIQFHPHHDNMNWNHMNIGRCVNYDLRQPSISQVPFHHPPQNLPVESSQLLPPLRNYLQTPVMNSDNQPLFGNMYRNHQPNNNFMTMPQLSVPPPIISQQTKVSGPQMPLSVVFSNQTQAQLLTPDQAVFSYSEKLDLMMQVLQLTDAQISILPVEDRQRLIQLREKIALSSQKD